MPTNPTDSPKLLTRLRREIRVRHLSFATEKTYAHWARRFILFHGKRHPAAMAEPEINAFLTHLAIERRVAATTQTQALCAILFLYRHVLAKDVGEIQGLVRAKRKRRLPVVLTRAEVRRVLGRLSGKPKLILTLLYGSGLRLAEGLRIRVKDIDFRRGELTVREGKGGKDRRTMLPRSLVEPLRDHLTKVRALHRSDLEAGFGRVELPNALARKYPSADKEWGWQYVFPASNISTDPRTGLRRRHHAFPQTVRRAMKRALRQAKVHKHATVHSLRHSFATHLLERGQDIRTLLSR